MRRALLVALVPVGVPLLLPGLAAAQPLNGSYVGFGAGAGFLLDQVQHAPKDQAAPAVKLDPGPGPAETGSLGYGFGNGLRVEVQGFHQANPGRNSFAPGR